MITGFPPAICAGILRTAGSALCAAVATTAGAAVAGTAVAGAAVAGAEVLASGVAVPQALSNSTARMQMALNNIFLDLGFIFSSPIRDRLSVIFQFAFNLSVKKYNLFGCLLPQLMSDPILMSADMPV